MPILELNGEQSAIRRFLRAIADALFRPGRAAADQQPREQPAVFRRGHEKVAPSPANTIRERLTEEMHCLEHLDSERRRRGDPGLEKTTEDRIIWGELLELELQQIDEEMDRMFHPPGRNKSTPLKSNPREGGPHERNDS